MSMARVHRPGAPDRFFVAMSDIEMGAGGMVDDFPHSAWLADKLRAHADQHPDLHLHLIFNGDTFDLLKTSYRGGWPHHITAEVAAGKMGRVADVHGAFFAGLRDVLAKRGRMVTIHFVAGNHDLELLFPEVQDILRALTTTDERVRFHEYSLDLGRAHFEHGSQLDPLFRVDPAKPFLDLDGKRILNLGWTSVSLLDVVIPLQDVLGHHDRLKPKKMVLELLPEVREYLLGLAWSYWTRDFWREFVGGKDPVKRMSWTMLREIVWRTATLDVDVQMDEELQRQMVAGDSWDLFVVGHQHEPMWWSFGDRKVLRTGCLRDEFMLADGGLVQRPINKTWAEGLLSGGEVVRSQLVEDVPPVRDPRTMPASIFEALPWVRERLGSANARRDSSDAQRDQERREGDQNDRA